MPESPDPQTVEYIQYTSVVMEKAAAINEAARVAAVKLAAAVPSAVDAVIAAGVAQEGDRAELTRRMTEEPDFACKVLTKTAQRVRPVSPSLGESTKQASANDVPQRTYFGGSRSSSHVRQSDIDFARGLGYDRG